MIAGTMPLDTGRIRRTPSARAALLDQEGELLPRDQTALQ